MGSSFTPPNCQFWLTSDFRVTFLFFGTYKKKLAGTRETPKVRVTWPLRVQRETTRNAESTSHVTSKRTARNDAKRRKSTSHVTRKTPQSTGHVTLKKYGAKTARKFKRLGQTSSERRLTVAKRNFFINTRQSNSIFLSLSLPSNRLNILVIKETSDTLHPFLLIGSRTFP
jgi:hypothetical protein